MSAITGYWIGTVLSLPSFPSFPSFPAFQLSSSFRIANNWLAQVDNKLYFNDQELSGKSNNLSGVAKLENIIVVVLSDELLLLTKYGNLI